MHFRPFPALALGFGTLHSEGFGDQMGQPHSGELFLNRILPQPGLQIREINPIKVLILVVAGIYEVFLSGIGLDMLAKALRADAFHHALHGRVD